MYCILFLHINQHLQWSPRTTGLLDFIVMGLSSMHFAMIRHEKLIKLISPSINTFASIRGKDATISD